MYRASLALFAFAASLSAQSTNSTPPLMGTGGTAPGQVVASTPTTSTKGSNSAARPVFISGQVVTDDGSPVPSNVSIQRVCSGISRTVAYTDEKGRFSFQWGQSSVVMADAADAGFGVKNSAPTGGFGGAQSAGGASGLASDPFANAPGNCELRASTGGYKSERLNLFARGALDSSDAGVIVLHHLTGNEGTLVSASSLMAPKDAKKAFDRGMASLQKGKAADAAKDFEKAVAIYPGYADAWMYLGKVRLQLKELAPSREALLKAVEADAKLVPPVLELGLMATQEENWAESERYMARAVVLDPLEYPQAWYTLAVAQYNLKKPVDAEKSVRQAIKLDPRHANPRAQYLLGTILEDKRDLAGAKAELLAYVQYSPGAPDLAQVQAEIRQIDKVLGDGKQAAK